MGSRRTSRQPWLKTLWVKTLARGQEELKAGPLGGRPFFRLIHNFFDAIPRVKISKTFFSKKYFLARYILRNLHTASCAFALTYL